MKVEIRQVRKDRVSCRDNVVAVAPDGTILSCRRLPSCSARRAEVVLEFSTYWVPVPYLPLSGGNKLPVWML